MMNQTKTKAELKEMLSFYDEEVNKIRNQVTSGYISAYKVFLLTKKLNLIGYKFGEISEEIKKKTNKIKLLKKYYKYRILFPFLVGIITPNLWLGIFILSIKFYLDIKIEAYMNGLKKENSEIATILATINEKANNTNDILKCKIEDINLRISKINEDDLKEVKTAYLLNLLDNQISVNEVPINVKNDISKILEYDLELTSSTFEELIDNAKESLKDETLKRELRLKN